MFDVHRRSAIAVITMGWVSLLATQADAIELTGAWASQADLCKLVFAKKGSQVAFAELSDLYGSGFIIDGNKITGRTAKCTIKSRKQEGDSLELSSACATSIMTSSVKFSLKIVDDNNILRTIPDVPGMTLKYTRCVL